MRKSQVESILKCCANFRNYRYHGHHYTFSPFYPRLRICEVRASWRRLPTLQTTSRYSSTGRGSSYTRSAYVHPLSQIILEHLQNSRADWIEKNQIDTKLTIKEDGTFEINFPGNMGKIWTYYDPEEKKHWLQVTRNNVSGEYLLQDNLKPAWHSYSESTPERIQRKVDEMINRLEEID